MKQWVVQYQFREARWYYDDDHDNDDAYGS